MGKLIYSFLLFSYKFAIILMMPFALKAKLMLSGRKGWKNKLARKFEGNEDPVVWFHSASLGEFEQTRPLIEKFIDEWPHYKILISFFSPSGFEVRKHFEPSYYVTYIPFDGKQNAKYWIDTVKPSIVFFTKYEFWHYFSSELKNQKIPLISFSSIFRPNQVYFKWYGGFSRNTLNNFTHFFVQNDESVKLLNDIGIENVSKAGDTRFDRVLEIADKKIDLQKITHFKGGKKLLVFGSVWKSDLSLIKGLIHRLSESYKFVIAPHEVDGKNIAELVSSIEVKSVLYSKITNKHDDPIMFLDTMGMLSSVYGVADAAYVGGAFGKGLHNVLEAAVFEIPVFFGNMNYTKFNEAKELINIGAAFPVGNGDEAAEILKRLAPEREIIANKIKKYFEEKRGATRTILNYCRKTLQQ